MRYQGGEQTLYDKEGCDLADTVPTNCKSDNEFLQCCEYAGLYAYIVTLLPTHQPGTNKIIARNRRIGVGIIDWIGWKHSESTHVITRLMRKGYKRIRKVTKWLSSECGTPEPIKVTTMKPNGTTAKMIGKRSGASYANFRYMVRRIRVQQYSDLYNILHNAKVPHEPDLFSANTEVFEYPLSFDDGCKTVEEVTLWEQFMNVILLQREWSDNAVSCTIMFKPKWILKRTIYGIDECAEYETIVGEMLDFGVNITEYQDNNFKIIIKRNPENQSIEIKEYSYNPSHEEDDIEPALSAAVPLLKTCSLSPHTPKGVYKQMPEEGISRQEYEKRKAEIKPIDWSKYGVISDKLLEGSDDKYCSSGVCELPLEVKKSD